MTHHEYAVGELQVQQKANSRSQLVSDLLASFQKGTQWNTNYKSNWIILTFNHVLWSKVKIVQLDSLPTQMNFHSNNTNYTCLQGILFCHSCIGGNIRVVLNNLHTKSWLHDSNKIITVGKWKYINISAVIDCRKYRLSEYSWNDTTCQLLMAVLIHKRHRKNHYKFVLAECHPYAEWNNTPATRWEVCFWSKHCT